MALGRSPKDRRLIGVLIGQRAKHFGIAFAGPKAMPLTPVYIQGVSVDIVEESKYLGVHTNN